MYNAFNKKIIIINLIALVLAIISVSHAIYAKNHQNQLTSPETSKLQPIELR
jgi:hypothetical protein